MIVYLIAILYINILLLKIALIFKRSFNIIYLLFINLLFALQ